MHSNTLVKSESVLCIFENVDEYLKDTRSFVIIYLALCPNTSPTTEEIARTAKNMRVNSGATARNEEKDPVIIYLKHEKLRCLHQAYVEGKLDSELEEGAVDLSRDCDE